MGCQNTHILTPTIDLAARQIGNAESTVETCHHEYMDKACSMNVVCTTVTAKTSTQTTLGAILGGAAAVGLSLIANGVID